MLVQSSITSYFSFHLILCPCFCYSNAVFYVLLCFFPLYRMLIMKIDYKPAQLAPFCLDFCPSSYSRKYRRIKMRNIYFTIPSGPPSNMPNMHVKMLAIIVRHWTILCKYFSNNFFSEYLFRYKKRMYFCRWVSVTRKPIKVDFPASSVSTVFDAAIFGISNNFFGRSSSLSLSINCMHRKSNRLVFFPCPSVFPY